jgi:NAD+ kinase
MKIFLYTRKIESEYRESVIGFIDFLVRQGCSIYTHETLKSIVFDSDWLDQMTILDSPNELDGIDLAVAIGGDGTVLELARYTGHWRIPLVGVNTGRLGFLSLIKIQTVKESFAQILNQEFDIEHRSFIEVMVNDEEVSSLPKALNEVAILGHPHNTMISVHAYVNDTFLATYWADGLMLATPTGSTAYSLSCGGPILSPEVNGFLITPIAPHNLNVRPLIIPISQKVTFIPESREGKFMMSIDGQSHYISNGTKITMQRSSIELRLVRLKEEHFFDTIRNKMGWGFDQRN